MTLDMGPAPARCIIKAFGCRPAKYFQWVVLDSGAQRRGLLCPSHDYHYGIRNLMRMGKTHDQARALSTALAEGA